MTTRMTGVSCALATALAVPALAAIVPDNGSGRFQFPPVAETYVIAPGYPPFQISAGLPAGTSVNINLSLNTFSGVVDGAGGSLGGTTQNWNAVTHWPMTGTGLLAGYNRNVNMSMTGQTALAPNPPFTSVAGLPTDLMALQGQLPPGDPDFDLLRITAGSLFGLPSPGAANGTILGPPGSNWSIDSFFDITYRIDFVGHPGGPFGGFSGSTTGTTRIWIVPAPGTALAAGAFALAGLRRRRR